MTAPASEIANPSAIEHAVLVALAYADVFDFPLTAAEARARLNLTASSSEVEATLQALSPRFVARRGPYWLLRGREAIASVRRQRSDESLRLMPAALRWGRRLQALPYVRMVAVTGSLAVANAEAGADIDYMIVTRDGRVWLARAFAVLLVRLAALRGIELCPNYVLSEAGLQLDQRDAYTAHELAQMLPVAGFDVYSRLLEANPWWRDFLPNASPAALSSSEAKAPAPKRLLERLLGGRLGDAIERRLLSVKGGSLRRASPAAAETAFDETVCKGHFDGHRERSEAALAARLSRLLKEQT